MGISEGQSAVLGEPGGRIPAPHFGPLKSWSVDDNFERDLLPKAQS